MSNFYTSYTEKQAEAEKEAGLKTFGEVLARLFSRSARAAERVEQIAGGGKTRAIEDVELLRAMFALRHSPNGNSAEAAQALRSAAAAAGATPEDAAALEKLVTDYKGLSDKEFADRLANALPKEQRAAFKKNIPIGPAGRADFSRVPIRSAAPPMTAADYQNLQLVKGDYPFYRDPEGYYYVERGSLRDLPDRGHAYMHDTAPEVYANDRGYTPLKHEPELEKALEASGRVRNVDADFRPLDGKPLPVVYPGDLRVLPSQLERLRANPDIRAGLVEKSHGKFVLKYQKMTPEGQRRWDAARDKMHYVVTDEGLNALLKSVAPPPTSGINAVRGTVPTTGKGLNVRQRLGNFRQQLGNTLKNRVPEYSGMLSAPALSW